jgi:hypothetical protein
VATIALLVVCPVVVWLIETTAPGTSLPPSESNRVHHPSGFSIVAPHEWRTVIEVGKGSLDDLIHFGPPGRGRYNPVVNLHSSIGSLDPAKMATGYVAGSFQHQPAYIRSGIAGKFWTYFIVFQRGERKYELSLLLPEKPEVFPPPDYQAYFETFRVDGFASTGPAIGPRWRSRCSQSARPLTVIAGYLGSCSAAWSWLNGTHFSFRAGGGYR